MTKDRTYSDSRGVEKKYGIKRVKSLPVKLSSTYAYIIFWLYREML